MRGCLFTRARYRRFILTSVLILMNVITQSVSQTLHTATASIFSPLLLSHLSCEEPNATYTLVRRVLTALIHHVKSAEHFATLGDLLIAQFTDVVSATYDEERFCRMLEIMAVPCAVRHGSRLSGRLFGFFLNIITRV